MGNWCCDCDRKSTCGEVIENGGRGWSPILLLIIRGFWYIILILVKIKTCDSINGKEKKSRVRIVIMLGKWVKEKVVTWKCGIIRRRIRNHYSSGKKERKAVSCRSVIYFLLKTREIKWGEEKHLPLPPLVRGRRILKSKITTNVRILFLFFYYYYTLLSQKIVLVFLYQCYFFLWYIKMRG